MPVDFSGNPLECATTQRTSSANVSKPREASAWMPTGTTRPTRRIESDSCGRKLTRTLNRPVPYCHSTVHDPLFRRYEEAQRQLQVQIIRHYEHKSSMFWPGQPGEQRSFCQL